MQKPHCSPWHSRNACCTGPSAPSGAVSPSTVVISRRRRGHGEHQAGPHRPAVDAAPCRRRRRRARSRRGCRSGRGRGAARRTAAAGPARRRRAATPLTVQPHVVAARSVTRGPRCRPASSCAAAQRPGAVSTRTSWRAVVGGGVDVVARARGAPAPRSAARPRASRRSTPSAERVGQVDHGRHVGRPRGSRRGPTTTASAVDARPRRRRRTARSRRAGGRPRRRPTPAPAGERREERRHGELVVAAAPTPAGRRRSRRPAIVAASRAPTRRVDASRRAARSTAGISAAGSACAMRADGGAAVADGRVGDVRAAPGAAAAAPRRTSASRSSTSACRASAPTRTAVRVDVDVVEARAARLMSTRWPGRPAAWTAAAPGSARPPAPCRPRSRREGRRAPRRGCAAGGRRTGRASRVDSMRSGPPGAGRRRRRGSSSASGCDRTPASTCAGSARRRRPVDQVVARR